jgi:DNA-binding MarR family transcriptional regulator
MIEEDDIFQVQQLYPRIYLACHREHQRKASSPDRISDRDSSVLAHLTVEGPKALNSASKLARHLNVTRATLSQALTNLIELGYVEEEVDWDDERRKRLRLTPKGRLALSRSSVLDPNRLRTLMNRLSARERKKVVEGMRLLADAALAP